MQRRSGHRRNRKPVLLFVGAIAFWVPVVLIASRTLVMKTESPVWWVMVPVLASVVAGVMRLDYDIFKGVDIWRRFVLPFPLDWEEHWISFKAM